MMCVHHVYIYIMYIIRMTTCVSVNCVYLCVVWEILNKIKKYEGVRIFLICTGFWYMIFLKYDFTFQFRFEHTHTYTNTISFSFAENLFSLHYFIQSNQARMLENKLVHNYKYQLEKYIHIWYLLVIIMFDLQSLLPYLYHHYIWLETFQK